MSGRDSAGSAACVLIVKVSLDGDARPLIRSALFLSLADHRCGAWECAELRIRDRRSGSFRYGSPSSFPSSWHWF